MLFPYIHLFSISLETHSKIDELIYLTTLEEKIIIAQFEYDYLHIINIDKKEQKQIAFSWYNNAEIFDLKKINNSLISILIDDEILLINCFSYQIETRIQLNNFVMNLNSLFFGIKENELLQVIYTTSDEQCFDEDLSCYFDKINNQYYSWKSEKKIIIYYISQLNYFNSLKNIE